MGAVCHPVVPRENPVTAEQVEAAYRRGNLLEKRRQVVPLRAQRLKINPPPSLVPRGGARAP